MADTIRTKAEILALLADNTNQDISPQDLRDAIVSLIPSYGGVYMATNATATAIATIDTLVVSNWGTNGLVTNLANFSIGSNGRLTYTGATDVHVAISCSLSAHVTVNAAKSLMFTIHKNGSEVNGSRIVMESTGNQDDIATSIHCDISMSTNDYVELWTANETDTNDITVTHAYLFALSQIA